jgi:predicted metal-dependent hydrolase
LAVSKKSEHIARRIEQFQGGAFPAHYLGYFDCFNHQLFYEAHDVLEDMWLPDRHGPDGSFYKGLIQLAGAFVHVQKNRPGPAVALLNLARVNLEKYPTLHHGLDLTGVLALIETWRRRLDGVPTTIGIFETVAPPSLTLVNSASTAPHV